MNKIILYAPCKKKKKRNTYCAEGGNRLVDSLFGPSQLSCSQKSHNPFSQTSLFHLFYSQAPHPHPLPQTQLEEAEPSHIIKISFEKHVGPMHTPPPPPKEFSGLQGLLLEIMILSMGFCKGTNRYLIYRYSPKRNIIYLTHKYLTHET